MQGSLLFLLLGVLSAVNAVIFKDCGSTAKNLNIKIGGCPDAVSVCRFPSGQNASIEAAFTPRSSFQKATVKLAASVGVIDIDFPMKFPEACSHWGLKCPGKAGLPQTLRGEVSVESSYPKIKIEVTLQLFDDKGETLICKSFPAEIK
ncbi:ML domain protein [Metarhizium robertsii]|uniref:Phosphatidylglycerol/phosphatidylinositol transfer protein n=1 Tax=Metarhizium robertsii TaxID=568076 RepID=A0A0A1V2I2_9HYPO|nr:ML domain protein [Metarhizium robertsii]